VVVPKPLEIEEAFLSSAGRAALGTRFAELFLENGGAAFSSLNCSINCSMPRSFHSSSGGGRMLLLVLVCSLKREARGVVVSSISSLIANAAARVVGIRRCGADVLAWVVSN
jgi:hypothetical protein